MLRVARASHRRAICAEQNNHFLAIDTKTSEKNKRKKQAEKTSGKNKRKKQAEKTIAAKAFIADFLEENGASGVQDIAIEIEKSLPRTRELMRELIQENIVEAQGEGPARKYILKDNQSKLK